jgi:hypothetical protein
VADRSGVYETSKFVDISYFFQLVVTSSEIDINVAAASFDSSVQDYLAMALILIHCGADRRHLDGRRLSPIAGISEGSDDIVLETGCPSLNVPEGQVCYQMEGNVKAYVANDSEIDETAVTMVTLAAINRGFTLGLIDLDESTGVVAVDYGALQAGDVDGNGDLSIDPVVSGATEGESLSGAGVTFTTLGALFGIVGSAYLFRRRKRRFHGRGVDKDFDDDSLDLQVQVMTNETADSDSTAMEPGTEVFLDDIEEFRAWDTPSKVSMQGDGETFSSVKISPDGETLSLPGFALSSYDCHSVEL